MSVENAIMFEYLEKDNIVLISEDIDVLRSLRH